MFGDVTRLERTDNEQKSDARRHCLKASLSSSTGLYMTLRRTDFKSGVAGRTV